MKRLLLLVPKGNGPGNNNRWNNQWPAHIENLITTNLWKIVSPGILIIASLTDPNRYEIEYIDEEFQTVNPDKYYDIVAMYIVTPTAKRGYMWANHFRSMGSYIVMGGVHVSVCSAESRRYADTILIGEAEIIWPQFLADYELETPKPVYIQPLGQLDINISPIPALNLLPEGAKKVIPLQTARGCPHGCKFCNLRGLYGKGYRAKTNSRVKEEINSALKVNQKSIIYFTDDNFFCDKERSKSLIHEVKEFGLTWYTNSDISLGNDESLLKLAFASGCRQVLIGFESIDFDNLSGIDENNFKRQYAGSYKDLIQRIQSFGIGVVGSFIVGFENDNYSVFEKLYQFITENNLFSSSITVNTPYPGTVLFEETHRKGTIFTYNWDEYTIFQPVLKMEK